MYETPNWLIDLLIRLDRWEDEHPSACSCETSRGLCLAELQRLVPMKVMAEARAVRDYLQQSNRGCTGPHICSYGTPRKRVVYCRESCSMCSGDAVRPCYADHAWPADEDKKATEATDGR